MINGEENAKHSVCHQKWKSRTMLEWRNLAPELRNEIETSMEVGAKVDRSRISANKNSSKLNCSALTTTMIAAAFQRHSLADSCENLPPNEKNYQLIEKPTTATTTIATATAIQLERSRSRAIDVATSHVSVLSSSGQEIRTRFQQKFPAQSHSTQLCYGY